jgi:hypothetical protein
MAEDFFEVLNACFTKQDDVNSETIFQESYMLLRYLSFYPSAFPLCNKINRYVSKLPQWAILCALHYGTKMERRWPKIKYLKKDKSEGIWPKELLNKVMKQFNCAEKYALQIIDILNATDEKLILKFGVELEVKK